MANQYKNEVVYNGQTLISLKEDTVTPDKVLYGETFHDRSGAPQTGSMITHNVYDGLDSTSTDDALSANMGKILHDNVTELTANNLNAAVDLSGYTSGEYYVFPSDGYIRVFCSADNYILYRLYGKTGTRFIFNDIESKERQTLFVKKGMRYECRAKSESVEIEFFGLV